MVPRGSLMLSPLPAGSCLGARAESVNSSATSPHSSLLGAPAGLAGLGFTTGSLLEMKSAIASIDSKSSSFSRSESISSSFSGLTAVEAWGLRPARASTAGERVVLRPSLAGCCCCFPDSAFTVPLAFSDSLNAAIFALVS